MNVDAFDDEEPPFSYQSQMREAKGFLRAKVGRYACEHPEMGLRELARQFGISRGLMHKIARDYSLGRGHPRALRWYGRYRR